MSQICNCQQKGKTLVSYRLRRETALTNKLDSLRANSTHNKNKGNRNPNHFQRCKKGFLEQ